MAEDAAKSVAKVSDEGGGARNHGHGGGGVVDKLDALGRSILTLLTSLSTNSACGTSFHTGVTVRGQAGCQGAVA